MLVNRLRALIAVSIFLFVSSAFGQNKVVVIPLFGDDAASKWRGEWVDGTAYKTSDIIEFDGSSYIALTNHTADLSNIPPSEEEWDLVAASGANGIDGIQGVKGDTGDQGIQGVKGDTGDQGIQGVKGDTGDQGPPGSAADSVAAVCMALVSSTTCDLTTVIAEIAASIYNVGDFGPAGGRVFYITDNGLHGMEAANTDLTSSRWGCHGTSISTSTAIDTGAANTAAIIAGCVSSEVTAAELANDYELNGFTDWFLPSKDELNQLYLFRNIVGGFVSDYYWSSSQNNSSLAWPQSFDATNMFDGNKTFSKPARAVRSF